VTSQSIVGTTGTKVSFDSPGPFVQGGIQLLGSPSTRVTIPKKSFYEVGATFQVRNTAGAATDVFYSWIAQNGTTVNNTLGVSPVGTSNALVTRTFTIATTTTSDYVELVAQVPVGNTGVVVLSTLGGTPASGASATVTIREV
jgi:hypothetical protein